MGILYNPTEGSMKLNRKSKEKRKSKIMLNGTKIAPPRKEKFLVKLQITKKNQEEIHNRRKTNLILRSNRIEATIFVAMKIPINDP
jgi:hypothetical protein